MAENGGNGGVKAVLIASGIASAVGGVRTGWFSLDRVWTRLDRLEERNQATHQMLEARIRENELALEKPEHNRPDPFTGKEGAALERRVELLEQQRFTYHPNPNEQRR
jgi:hypothetical protein